FVSTARDLARFYAQLDPAAKRSVLAVASRREMIRPQWRTPQFEQERHYGLGIASARVGDWDTFGHGGGFQGFITNTLAVPGRDRGRLTAAGPFASPGEAVRLTRGPGRRVTGVQFAGSRLLPERQVAAEIRRRYRG